MRAEAAAAAKGKRSLGRGGHHCYDDCSGRIANPLPHATIAGMRVIGVTCPPALRALPSTNHIEPLVVYDGGSSADVAQTAIVLSGVNLVQAQARIGGNLLAHV